MRMINELERRWKEAVVVQFKVGLVSRHLPVETEENHLSQDRRSPGRDLNSGPPKCETGVVITRQRRSMNYA
jgi:hypothetical protein